MHRRSFLTNGRRHGTQACCDGGAAILWLAPGVAYAIAASLSDAGDGSVTDSSISIGRNNWGGDGQIRSYSSSKNVYFGSLLVYNSYPDANCGRSSTDTNSTSYVSKRVSCNTMAVSPNADGVRIRICQNKPIVSDPCGGWYNTHWR